MRVDLFGVGTKSTSPAITAQRRINCYVDIRKERDRTNFALVGRWGLTQLANLGANPTRGVWPVNTIGTPLEFIVNAQTLYSTDNVGNVANIGNLATSSGDVSMADDGTYLVIVDGSFGYVYNMVTGVGPTLIVDGNFTTAPRTVTWQDGYFIVTASDGRQFQLSQISPGVDPTVWPAVQIGFAGSGAGALRNGLSDHSVLHLFGDVYTEFWQNSGSPDFPFSLIPGASQEFGLAAPWSLAKFDNGVVGLFQNKQGGVTASRLQGFSLRKISDQDIDDIFSRYSTVSDCEGWSMMMGGHPLYVLHFHSAEATWVYDGLSSTWCEWQNPDGSHFNGHKFGAFINRLTVGNHDNGLIGVFDQSQNSDYGVPIPMEVVSKHIWNDDKYIGISQLQVDVESGVGTATGQGANPVMQLLVSKDGGSSFFSVGYSSVGRIGDKTTRVIWSNLGAARDWVLKLRITDPVFRVITGSRAEMEGAPF